MPRFELRDGRADKRWSIDRSGAEVATSWGTIGEPPQSSVRRFDTRDEAIHHVVEQLGRRRRSGWVRSVPASTGFAYDEALAARVRESFSDEAFAVYGDFLQESGDRRGELLVLELAAARGEPAARDEARALRAEIDHALVGAGAELLHDRLHVDYHAGFPVFASLWAGELADGVTLRAIVSDPAFAFLRELEVRWTPGALSSCLTALAAPTLTTLALRQFHSLDQIAGLLAGDALPALRRLTLAGVGSDGLDALLASPILAGLSELDVRELDLGDEASRRLVDAAPTLEHLAALHVSDDDMAESLRARGVRVAGAPSAGRGA